MVSEEWIEPVEPSGGRIVVAGSEVLLADLGVELFAGIEEFRRGLGRHETDRLTVSIVMEDLIDTIQLRDRTGNVQQNPRTSVAVKGEVELLNLPGFFNCLAYPLMSDNVP